MADKPVPPNTDDGSFVARIVEDPANVPDVMLLYGYPGASSEEGHERLYLSADLGAYVEIPAAAILHRAAAPREQDPHGGTTLWVRRDAALIQKLAPAAQALAHFFAGAIQAQAAGPAPGAFPAITIGGPVCGVTLPHICQIASAVCTVAGPCATRGVNCPTQAGTCDCTDFGCRTDITPCINTHAATCGPCPSVIGVCQSFAGCNSGGGDCTFIGCGHSLACTNGLLCAAGPQVQAAAGPQGMAAAGPQGMAAAAGPGPALPQPGPIGSQICTVVNSCAFPCQTADPTREPFCSLFGPCVTINTCAGPCLSGFQPNCQSQFFPCVTVPPRATCAPLCTIAGPCQSAFAPCVTVPPRASCVPQCTIALPICGFRTPFCPDRTPLCFTPDTVQQFSPGCPPPVSPGCGFPGQGPGDQAARMGALPTFFAHCSQVCSQTPWMGCGHGCATNTVM